ncbi:HNH endonuclease [Bacillus sp. FJAT-22090]|uniref:HNH endonuclease n=1 Tax=Bacillus sp. FJAT-22090 TaxID=1581038 RepID=UPI0011A084D5|nr:HNH endonuclease [Bacillus sp. FJAT-22090]
MNTKVCSICKVEKEITEFYSQKKKSVKKGEYIYHNPYCKQCTIQKGMKWESENKERTRERQRERMKRKDVQPYVKEQKRKYVEAGKHKIWQSKNKDKMSAYGRKRNQNKTHEISKEEWKNCKDYFNYKCAYCELSVDKHYRLWYGEMKQFDLHREHVDHTGSNKLDNCVPSCHFCNSSKREYSLEEWYNKDNPNFSQERLDKIIKWLNDDYKLYMKL